jgi:hypothetical protein
VRERRSGIERGWLTLSVVRVDRRGRTTRVGEFVATSLDDVVFF